MKPSLPALVYFEMFQQSPDCVSLTRLSDGKVVEVNPNFTRIFGFTREETLGKTSVELGVFDSSETRRKLIEPLAAGGELQAFEVEDVYRHKSGRKIFVSINATTLEIDGTKYIVSTIRDITERKAREREREEEKERLNHIQKMESLAVLASGVAHDINNVLGVVLGLSSMLNERAESKLDKEDIAGIESATRRGKALVENLLLFAREDKPRLATLALNECLERTVFLLRRSLLKTSDVVLNTDPAVTRVMGDESRLCQVVMNLCTNAFDASDGRATITITSRTARSDEAKPHLPKGEYAQVVVSDNGPGMPPEVLKRVFEPFFTTKPIGKGTGLGLSTSLNSVEAMGGALQLDSVVGEGTTATIWLPTSKSRSEKSHGDQTVPSASDAIDGLRVLVVDDEPLLRNVLFRALTAKGCKVLTADSGQSALEVVDERPNEIDIVLLDLTMPGMSGEECIRRLRELRPDVRIVACSGLMSAEKAGELHDAGVVGVVAKPASIDEIAATLSDAMRNVS